MTATISRQRITHLAAPWPLSPRQREFRSTAEAFAEADIAPIARVCDDERRLPMVMRVTSAAAAMLGSLGYTGQSEVEKLLRDARHVAIVEGPEPIHKEIIFAHVLQHGGY